MKIKPFSKKRFLLSLAFFLALSILDNLIDFVRDGSFDVSIIPIDILISIIFAVSLDISLRKTQ